MSKTSLLLTSGLAIGDFAFGFIPLWVHLVGSLVFLMVFAFAWKQAGGH